MKTALYGVLALSTFLTSAIATELPPPSWEWNAADDADRMFDSREIPAQEAASQYDINADFSVEVRLKPVGEQTRLGGIVSDYGESNQGGWYLSMSSTPPFLNPTFVAIDDGQGYRTMRSKAALTPEVEQTLYIIKNNEGFTMWLDNELVAELPGIHPMHRGDKNKFRIGKRRGDFFHGEIQSVKLWDKAIPFPGKYVPLASDNKNESTSSSSTPTGNLLINTDFEKGDTLDDALLWHRMTGTSAAIPSGWEIDDTQAYHGQRSLKGSPDAKLMLNYEVWQNFKRKEPYVFSVWMKADQDGVTCDVSIGAYARLVENVVSKSFTLTKDWKRYEMEVSDLISLSGRHTNVQGPLNFSFLPKGGTVWIDAVQWESGKTASEWKDADDEIASQPIPEYPDVSAIPLPKGEQSSWQGEIPIYADASPSKDRRPISMGIPFAKSRWNGQGKITLKNEKGESLPVQTELLAAPHLKDGVRMVGIHFTDVLDQPRTRYTLQIEPGPQSVSSDASWQWTITPPSQPGLWWDAITSSDKKTILGPTSLRAIGLDGTVYDSEGDKDTTWKIEQDGPLYRVVRMSGRLLNTQGEALIGYVARIHMWRDIPGIQLEVTALNTREAGSVPVRSIFWHGKSTPESILGEPVKDTGRYEVLLENLDGKQDAFSSVITRPEGKTQRHGKSPQTLEAIESGHPIVLHVPEAWQRNPSAIAWENGEWIGYLWPGHGIRTLLFPRGMALTRNFWLREGDSSTAGDWETPVIAMASADWWAQNDLIIPLGAANTTLHPVADAQLTPGELMGKVDDKAIENTHAYGLFDYGDFHGDGGWGNLESFIDWSSMLIGLRSEDSQAIQSGLRSARHYRDMDMNQLTGLTYVHNMNHLSGSNDPSHAWPSGVAMHYLLTGSKRSKEIMLMYGERAILGSDVQYMATTGLRSLGRWILNLGDVYLLSGDQRFIDRYNAQVEASRAALAADKDNPDRSIFSYIGHSDSRRLVPFHAWYGIAGLQRMQDLTGDDRYADFIEGEIRATLNPELYREDIAQLWPSASYEEGMPIILSDYGLGRGSFVYPNLISLNKPEDTQLALDTFYIWLMEGRGKNRIESFLGSAPLRTLKAPEEEKRFIEKAKEQLWNAAADGLMNGDFSVSPDHWRYWRPFPSKSISVHTNWERTRKKMVSLDETTRKQGPRSLRFNLKPEIFQNLISVDTNRFRLAPGSYRYTGWVRWDDGSNPPYIGLQIRDLDGNYNRLSLGVTEEGRLQQGDTVLGPPDAVSVLSASLSKPESDGWRKFDILIKVEKRVVANVAINARLKPGAKKGHLWLDSIDIQPDNAKPSAIP